MDKQLDNLLKECLTESKVLVTFKKKDGTIRNMLCTLNPEYMPQEPEGKEKKERKVNENVQVVYDIEAPGWRSFRWDSLQNYTIQKEGSNE